MGVHTRTYVHAREIHIQYSVAVVAERYMYVKCAVLQPTLHIHTDCDKPHTYIHRIDMCVSRHICMYICTYNTTQGEISIMLDPSSRMGSEGGIEGRNYGAVIGGEAARFFPLGQG